MDNLSLILDKKYIQLKQILIDGQGDKFEEEISKFQFDELLEFAYYAFKTYKGNDFTKDYFGIKILGELTYLCSTRELLVFNSSNFEEDKFWDLIFRGLGHASQTALNLGYYRDSERYGLQVINYPKIDTSDLTHFLSNLAICAHKMNNRAGELDYCERMMKVDDKNPKIWVNYAYALMRNKLYEKSKLYLEKCLDFGYEQFPVYNQLAVVTMYGYKDYEKAYSYLEKILKDSNSGKNLNERNRFVLFSNLLSVGGLSGNEKILENIIEFKKLSRGIPDKIASEQWFELSQICEGLNKGIYALDKGDILKALGQFQEIEKFKWKGGVMQLVKFLKNICLIIKESKGVKNASDLEAIINFIINLDSIELFDEYKGVIEIYFSLLHSFYSLLEGKKEIIDITDRKEQIKKFHRINLTTSDFINKSFKLIKLIEQFQIDYPNSILKERIKEEYRTKLELLINSNIDIVNETTFLYSLNRIGNINQAVCELLVKSINLMQKNEPSFVRNYKLKKERGEKISLLETDFRDIIYRSFGLSYDIEISAEALSRVGRTDLQISSPKFGTKTFEFKIWGSNDYKSVVKQLYEYLTDFEDEGFIFMANKNKSSIDSDYIDNMKSDGMGYIEKSFSEEEISGFKYYVSQHKIHAKTKTIYHFIYNMY